MRAGPGHLESEILQRREEGRGDVYGYPTF